MKSCLMCANVCGVVVASGLRLSQDGDIIIKDYQNAVSPTRAHLEKAMSSVNLCKEASAGSHDV
jgi:hypothetical protein